MRRGLLFDCELLRHAPYSHTWLLLCVRKDPGVAPNSNKCSQAILQNTPSGPQACMLVLMHKCKMRACMTVDFMMRRFLHFKREREEVMIVPWA